ncbi:hypothetical protein [Nocardia nova]|uniref:hypothetical protein n=1 Tax=Nocardia nova TaxID=37330 RepID=UPI0025AFF77D|nr:hypothetical protein [Nocardia nova]
MNSAQLRAALAVLGIDSDHISSRAANSADVGLPDIERAMLAGLLYRVAGTALRQAITENGEVSRIEARGAAAVPRAPWFDGEDPIEQTVFEAFWLVSRVNHMQTESARTRRTLILEAARRAAAATKDLLRLHHSLLRKRQIELGDREWPVVLRHLEQAHALTTNAASVADPEPVRQ